MKKFRATIQIIGINPYVLLPELVLKYLFEETGKDKGPIPVKGTIEGYPYIQTLVKYSGKWRLYVNWPMLKESKKSLGDAAKFTIEADKNERVYCIHPELEKALQKNKIAKKVFERLSPSRKKEIIRYINNLKSKDAIKRNIQRAINFLTEKDRFTGRDKP